MCVCVFLCVCFLLQWLYIYIYITLATSFLMHFSVVCGPLHSLFQKTSNWPVAVQTGSTIHDRPALYSHESVGKTTGGGWDSDHLPWGQCQASRLPLWRSCRRCASASESSPFRVTEMVSHRSTTMTDSRFNKYIQNYPSMKKLYTLQSKWGVWYASRVYNYIEIKTQRVFWWWSTKFPSCN